tara:strand:+ start:3156 stop:4700 length:1545 start_codon:yes stop_codon:yes gene_type:complete
MNDYELIYKNWQGYAKGSYDHHDQAEESLLLESLEMLPTIDNHLNEDLLALRYLNDEISLEEYTKLSSHVLLYEDRQRLNELNLEPVKDVLLDIIQVAGGAGAIVGTGGFGGDTLVDSIMAVESSASALKSIVDVVDNGSKLLKDLVEGVKKINLEGGLDAIYKGVQQILGSITRTFKNAKELFDKLKDEILSLVGRSLRGVEKWISTIIPDDAGTIGIAIRETVEWLIEKAASNIYKIMSGAINKLPDFAKDLVFDSNALESFLTKVIDTFLTAVDKGLEVKDKGQSALKTMAGLALDVLGGPALAIAREFKGPILEQVRKILAAIKTKIPTAVKTARFIFTIFFGLMAAFQVIMAGDYDEAKPEVTVAMPDYGPRTAAARTATVAMPAGAVTEHLKKWENYDPTASKKVSKISIKEMIVIKGNERWGIRAAIKNIAEGRRSKSKDNPIQVTWILSEDKFLITDGYHRLVEELMQGNKEFLCEVDWSGYSLDWRVPELSNRFIMENKSENYKI